MGAFPLISWVLLDDSIFRKVYNRLRYRAVFVGPFDETGILEMRAECLLMLEISVHHV